MVGLKRRRRVEGWAVDVSETDAQVGRATLMQRLAENNKLWLGCALGVVVLTVGMMRGTDKARSIDEKYLVRPAGARAGTYDDFAHREFAKRFASERSGKASAIEARFVGPDNFEITVPGNMSKDDIDFLAKVAGMKIVHEFHFRPVVQVYAKGAGGRETLVATAQWETKKFGFVVKLPRPPTK